MHTDCSASLTQSYKHSESALSCYFLMFVRSSRSCEEYAFHRGPSKCLAYQEAYDEHADELAERCDYGLAACSHKFLEAELQSETEHKEDDTDVGPLFYGLLAGYAEDAEVGAYDETGDDVAEYERLLQGPADDCAQSCRDKYYR